MTSDLHRWPERSSYASERWRLESCRERSSDRYQYWISIDSTGAQLGSGQQAIVLRIDPHNAGAPDAGRKQRRAEQVNVWWLVWLLSVTIVAENETINGFCFFPIPFSLFFFLNQCLCNLQVNVSQTASSSLLTCKTDQLPLLLKTKHSPPPLGRMTSEAFLSVNDNNQEKRRLCQKNNPLCARPYLRQHKKLHHHQPVHINKQNHSNVTAAIN